MNHHTVDYVAELYGFTREKHPKFLTTLYAMDNLSDVIGAVMEQAFVFGNAPEGATRKLAGMLHYEGKAIGPCVASIRVDDAMVNRLSAANAHVVFDIKDQEVLATIKAMDERVMHTQPRMEPWNLPANRRKSKGERARSPWRLR